MLRCQQLQSADRLAVAAERKHRLETLLLGSDPFLLQPFSLGPKRWFIEQVCKGPASPQRERLLERGEATGRGFGATSGFDEPLEAGRVDRLVGSVQPYRAPARLEQPVGAEGLAQARDVDVERMCGRRGRILGPQRVDEHVARNRLVSVE